MEGNEIEEDMEESSMEEYEIIDETKGSTVKERNRRKQDLRYEKLRATAHDNLKVTSIMFHFCSGTV
jgi:hypothetical protein